MTKPKALVFATQLPFPARRNGVSIRYASILRRLRESYDVHLVLALDHDVSAADVDEGREQVNQLHVFRRKRASISLARRLLTRASCSLPGSTPYPLFAYDADAVADFLRQHAMSEEYDLVLVVTSDFLEVVQSSVKYKRFVVDAIDSVAMAFGRSDSRSFLKRFDSFRLRRWERRMAQSVDYWNYVSPADLQHVFGTSVDAKRIGVIPNGIFLDDFESPSEPVLAAPVIGFLGNMAYPPNISAVQFLFRVFERVRTRVPDAKLLIIGRTPVPEIEAMSATPGVHITGTVDSIWPYVHSTTLFAFPMLEGAGQQNKVLEAMAAAVPVITTAVGCAGIGTPDAQWIRIAETEDAFVSTILELLANPAEMTRVGLAGKAFVESHYSWDQIMKLIDERFLGHRSDLGSTA